MNEADNIRNNGRIILIFFLCHAKALLFITKYFRCEWKNKICDRDPKTNQRVDNADHVATYERQPNKIRNKPEYENIKQNIMREIV